MPQEYQTISDQKNPFRILATVLVLSTIAIMWSLLTIYNASEEREQQHLVLLDIQSMRGDILYNKGLMDKAVFMSAFTADPKWRAQYNTYHQAMLNAFIKLRERAPNVLEEVAEDLTSANDRILDIHKSAFLLIEANFKEEAMFMLVDSEYETYEKRLKETLQKVDQQLDKIVRIGQIKGKENLLNSLFLTTGLIVIVFMSWFISWIILNRWRKAIKAAEKEREWMLHELEESTRAVEKSQSEYQAIIEHAVDGIMTMNVQGEITSCNKSSQKILRSSEWDILDKKLETIIPSIHAESNRGNLFSLPDYFDQVGTDRTEYSIYSETTKQEIPIEVTISKIVLEENDTYTALIRDISAKKAAEEAKRKMDIAQRKNEAKSQFLANMSHELRTPMNGIIGMSDLILRTDLTEKQEDFALTIRKSANGLHNVINDILDFSKIEEGALLLEPIPFNLHQSIDDVADVFSSIAESKGLGLMIRYLPGTIENIVGDPGRICQILNNLVNNAIKFTDSGHILMTVKEERRLSDDKVIIKFSVKDTGIGISEERKNEIFKRFTQADESITRQFGGTGLGLTISKELSHLMNGEMGVDSEEGKGSTFWFTITVEVSKKIEEDNFIENLPEDCLKNKNALVVEDNEINAKIIREHLGFFGMNCTLVPNAEDADILLNDHYNNGKEFDVAIIDHKLPGMNGLMFGKHIQDNQMLKSLPLIAFTSVVTNSSFKDFEDAGFSGYLTKPIKTDVLKNIVSFIISKGKPEKGIVTRHSLMNKRNNLSTKLQNNYRILIVEDDKVNQKVAKNLLKGLGCTPVVADNGRIALDMLAEDEDFDLIFMDMQMPELDGISATKCIREIEKEENKDPITIIALTANATKEDKERCLSAGMNDFLSKPITIDACEQAVLNWEEEYLKTPYIPKEINPLEADVPILSKEKEDIAVDMGHFASITLDDKELQLEIAQDFMDDAEITINKLLGAEIGSEIWVKSSHKLTGSSLNVGAKNLAAICKKAEFDFTDCSKEEMITLVTEAYEPVKKFFTDMINKK